MLLVDVTNRSSLMLLVHFVDLLLMITSSPSLPLPSPPLSLSLPPLPAIYHHHHHRCRRHRRQSHALISATFGFLVSIWNAHRQLLPYLFFYHYFELLIVSGFPICVCVFWLAMFCVGLIRLHLALIELVGSSTVTAVVYVEHTVWLFVAPASSDLIILYLFLSGWLFLT